MFDAAVNIIWDGSGGRLHQNYVYLIFVPCLLAWYDLVHYVTDLLVNL
jgi:hypothetical protein